MRAQAQAVSVFDIQFNHIFFIQNFNLLADASG